MLPNFARLAREGHYQALPTTNPAQSPVAWSTFATGLNPGEHGIFDFLRRDSETYAPEYSISEIEQPEHVLRAFGYQLPLDGGATRNRRVGTPFWVSAEREGHRSSVLRVPVTYPADPITRMLSGMGVPDLLGTQGTFTFYTTEAVESGTTGGRIVTVEPTGVRVETTLEGPPHPFYQEPVPLAVPLVIEAAGADRVRIALDDAGSSSSRRETWSDWITVEFGFAGVMGVNGLVRLYLVEAFPAAEALRLADPVPPAMPPPGRSPCRPTTPPSSRERIGLYHTIGMPEETWSLNEERISDQAYLEMVETILEEREAMLFDTLDAQDSDLVVQVFVQPDRVSHMFWRGLDPQHPLYEQTDERASLGRPVDLPRGRPHLGPGARSHEARRSPDRPERPWLQFLPPRGSPQPLARRGGLSRAAPRPAELGVAVHQRRLDEDQGLRARPQRHLPQSEGPRSAGHRARRGCRGAQAGDRGEAEGFSRPRHRRGGGRDRPTTATRSTRPPDRRCARSGDRLCQRLSRLLADGARRRAGAAGRGQRQEMERRPLHRALLGAWRPVHVLQAFDRSRLDRRSPGPDPGDDGP